MNDPHRATPGKRGLGHRLAATCLLVALSVAVSGCVVEPRGGGWCFWHPYRCR